MTDVMVSIPVDEATAKALTDPDRLAAVVELVKQAVHPTAGQDLLAILLDGTRRKAEMAGLTDQDIDTELGAWKTERATRRR